MNLNVWDANGRPLVRSDVFPVDPKANVSASPVAGANSFTREQAQAAIEKRGYSRVSRLELNDKGVWGAWAMRYGQPVHVTLDFQGNVN